MAGNVIKTHSSKISRLVSLNVIHNLYSLVTSRFRSYLNYSTYILDALIVNIISQLTNVFSTCMLYIICTSTHKAAMLTCNMTQLVVLSFFWFIDIQLTFRQEKSSHSLRIRFDCISEQKWDNHRPGGGVVKVNFIILRITFN